MTSPFVARQDPIEYAAPPPVADGLYRVEVRRLFKGVFVAALDRPWADTPFPPGGFRVDDDRQLAVLRARCRFVTVDARLSAGELAGAIRAVAMLCPPEGASTDRDGAGTGPGTDARTDPAQRPPAARRDPARPAPGLRDDVRVDAASRRRVNRLLERAREDSTPEGAGARSTGFGIVGRVHAFTGRFAFARRGGPMRVGDDAALTPDETALVASEHHPPEEPVGRVVPVARQVHARALAALAKALEPVRRGRPLEFPPLAAAACDLAECAATGPDALLWCERFHAQHAPARAPSLHTAILMLKFGRHLGLPADEWPNLALIGMLSDVGMLRVPDALLDHPGVLGAREFAEVRKHVASGVKVLQACNDVPAEVVRAVALHHERLDGSGYPRGLSGSAVGLRGAMAGIVDCFSALTTPRPYAKALAVEDALAALHDWSGRLFARSLVEHFIVSIGVFPVGSLVELATGEVAMVVDRHRLEPLRSRVVVIAGADKRPLPAHGADGVSPTPDRFVGPGATIARGLPVGAFGLSLREHPG